MKICKIEGCDRSVLALNMCQTHYHREYQKRCKVVGRDLPIAGKSLIKQAISRTRIEASEPKSIHYGNGQMRKISLEVLAKAAERRIEQMEALL